MRALLRFIGGPQGDAGLAARSRYTTYGGWDAHGGGVFLVQRTPMVDRSAALTCRPLASRLCTAVVQTLLGAAFLRDWRREVAAGLWTKDHHRYVLRLGWAWYASDETEDAITLTLAMATFLRWRRSRVQQTRHRRWRKLIHY